MEKIGKKLKVGIVMSGKGSNMYYLFKEATHMHYYAYWGNSPYDPEALEKNYHISAVVYQRYSDGDPEFIRTIRDDCEKLGYMCKFGFFCKNYPDSFREHVLYNTMIQCNVDIICLAGYMYILSDDFINKWNGYIINIHPSLLPKYKGLNTHERVLANGDSTHGCTVHHVIPELDSGPIIMQKEIKVYPNECVDDLAARVLNAEHILYPKALDRVVNEHLTFQYFATIMDSWTNEWRWRKWRGKLYEDCERN